MTGRGYYVQTLPASKSLSTLYTAKDGGESDDGESVASLTS